MAEMVFSAIIQDGVSRAFSFVLGKRKEKASQGEIVLRLQTAVYELNVILQLTEKVPITDTWLLLWRRQLKHTSKEGADLLEKYKGQALQGQQEIGQGVIPSSSSKRAKKLQIAPLFGLGMDGSCLSLDDVQRFEQTAKSARNFLTYVESGCTLRHHRISNPLVKHLFEWKTLAFLKVQGTESRCCYISPIRVEERTVEAQLGYKYSDSERIEKSFRVRVLLQLSESTDIFGTAIKCLQFLKSQTGLIDEHVLGELTQLVDFQDFFHSNSPMLPGLEEKHTEETQQHRPDPICCKTNGHDPCANNVSLGLLQYLPEQVNVFRLECYISAPECSMSRSTNGKGKNVIIDRVPLLYLEACIMPHSLTWSGLEEGAIAEAMIDNKMDAKNEVKSGGTQEVVETLRSKAIDKCFIRQPELMQYMLLWFSNHNAAHFTVNKCTLPAPKGRSKTRRPTKRRL